MRRPDGAPARPEVGQYSRRAKSPSVVAATPVHCPARYPHGPAGTALDDADRRPVPPGPPTTVDSPDVVPTHLSGGRLRRTITATIDYVAGPSRRCFTLHVDASRSSGLPSAGRDVRHRAPPARWFPTPTSCASECPWARRSSEASAQCPPRPVRAKAIQQSAPARDERSDDLRHGRVLATVSDRLTGSLSNPRRGAVDTSVGRGRVRRFGSSCQQLCT